ncbi:hypothetical protein DUNSADRAFT_18443 [Dunaliella salina]|uniref:Encoded protein n=1 Tax=Dunaliella salina TaxID=3046 RepID=A0ABQ7G037_DUNSA|nr:hypothetical protein DUNSADRAFT_18443 [Dunaliella salina]|eukprot:KAF5827967.1 hypothetical protein DUNSADRAFT_18443 [Dunaliella salina]
MATRINNHGSIPRTPTKHTCLAGVCALRILCTSTAARTCTDLLVRTSCTCTECMRIAHMAQIVHMAPSAMCTRCAHALCACKVWQRLIIVSPQGASSSPKATRASKKGGHVWQLTRCFPPPWPTHTALHALSCSHRVSLFLYFSPCATWRGWLRLWAWTKATGMAENFAACPCSTTVMPLTNWQHTARIHSTMLITVPWPQAHSRPSSTAQLQLLRLRHSHTQGHHF